MPIDPSIVMGYRGLGELPNPMNQLAQVSQIQSSQRQSEAAQMQLQQMRRDEAALAQFYSAVAKNGGPTTATEIENVMINSRVPSYVSAGMSAKSKRLGLENERRRLDAISRGESPDMPAIAAPNALLAAQPMTPQGTPALVPTAAPAIASEMPPTPASTPSQINQLKPSEVNAPVANAMVAQNDVQAQIAKLTRMRNAYENEDTPRSHARAATVQKDIDLLTKPHTQTVDGQVVERQPDGTYRVVFGEQTASPITRMQRELAKLPPNDPKRPALEAEINKAKVTQEQGAERIKIQWGTLNVAQQNLAVNQASLKLRQDAPKNGLTDPDDIERVALAVASGRIPVDRLNSGTAKIYANLLKTNPNLDLTNLSIEQAGARTGSTTSARIAARQTLTNVDATRAENIAKGNLPPATGLNADKIMNAVIAINPEYNARDYGLQTTAEKSFNTGKQGDKTRSLNVAVSHLGTLDTAATALHANDIRAFNQFSQAWQRETGKPAPTNFNAVKELVADEIVAAVVPGVGSLADRKALKDTIMAKSSPAQLQGVIKQYKELLGGQLGGLEQQYAATTRKTDFKQRYLTPETTAALRPSQSASPAGAASTATSPPPAGVDAALWNVMTTDERKLWQK